MTFTPEQINVIVIAMTALTTAFGAIIVNIIVAVRQGSALKENTKITQDVATDTKVIKGHVNSQATADAAKIASQEEIIMELRKAASDAKEIAALLAQRVADKPAEPAEVKIVNEPHAPVPVADVAPITKPTRKTKP